MPKDIAHTATQTKRTASMAVVRRWAVVVDTVAAWAVCISLGNNEKPTTNKEAGTQLCERELSVFGVGVATSASVPYTDHAQTQCRTVNTLQYAWALATSARATTMPTISFMVGFHFDGMRDRMRGLGDWFVVCVNALCWWCECPRNGTTSIDRYTQYIVW